MEHLLDILKSVVGGCIVLGIQVAHMRWRGTSIPDPATWFRAEGPPKPPARVPDEVYRERRALAGAVAGAAALFVLAVLSVLAGSFLLDGMLEGEAIDLTRLPVVGGWLEGETWGVLGAGVVFRSTMIATGLGVASYALAWPVVALHEYLGYLDREPWLMRVFAFPVAWLLWLVHSYYLSGTVSYLGAWGHVVAMLALVALMVAGLVAWEASEREKREADG